jgi:hypothetical protein
VTASPRPRRSGPPVTGAGRRIGPLLQSIDRQQPVAEPAGQQRRPGWPGCIKTTPSWMPRPHNARAAPAVRGRPGPPQPAPAATNPQRGSSHGAATRHSAPGDRQHHRPDSRLVHGNGCALQGCNAQAVPPSTRSWPPSRGPSRPTTSSSWQMITVTTATLTAGITQRPGQLAADSGCWSTPTSHLDPRRARAADLPARPGRHGKPRKHG